MGPTGAGKSSVLQLLMRFYDPDEGGVLFDGVDIRDRSPSRRCGASSASCSRRPSCSTPPSRENIGAGQARRHRRRDRGGGQGGRAARLRGQRCLGATTPWWASAAGGCRVGRRQRLSIARALLRDPSVLLLDEATSALDPRTERLIADTLERVGEGRTTIAVTHRLTSITGYDQIFVVVAGQRGRAGHPRRAAGRRRRLRPAVGRADRRRGADRGPLRRRRPPWPASRSSASLGPGELADVAARLRAIDLAAGERMPEGGGRLSIIRRGRATVLAPDFTGELASDGRGRRRATPSGCRAAGRGEGLRAAGHRARSSLLVIDDEAIRGLAAVAPGDRRRPWKAPARPAAGPAGGTAAVTMTMASPAQPDVHAPGGPWLRRRPTTCDG